MGVLTYRETGDVPVDQLRALYEDVGWSTVTVRSNAVLAASIAGAQVVCTCWDGPRLVGILRAVGDGARCAHILDLAVLRAYQRRGIGSELLRRGLDRLRHCDYISLMTDASQMGFYRRFGFLQHPESMLIRREVQDPMRP
jgi:ribosomal protein S18 acetylase RimI-like enzyme